MELVECCFTSTETVGLLGTGAQDGYLDFHTELLNSRWGWRRLRRERAGGGGGGERERGNWFLTLV